MLNGKMGTVGVVNEVIIPIVDKRNPVFTCTTKGFKKLSKHFFVFLTVNIKFSGCTHDLAILNFILEFFAFTAYQILTFCRCFGNDLITNKILMPLCDTRTSADNWMKN